MEQNILKHLTLKVLWNFVLLNVKNFSRKKMSPLHVKTQRKVMSDSRKFYANFAPPPCYSGGLQNGITFFLLGPCRVWKSMLDKSFHFVCFSKKKGQNFYVCKKMRSGWGFLTQTIWRIFLQNEKFWPFAKDCLLFFLKILKISLVDFCKMEGKLFYKFG